MGVDHVLFEVFRSLELQLKFGLTGDLLPEGGFLVLNLGDLLFQSKSDLEIRVLFLERLE